MSEMLNNNETNNKFLSLQHVEKIYPNGAKAVYDFNLDVEKNEFIVIVGPSGCGKTTTLRMIAGLEDISLGEIYLENELLNYKPSKDRKIAIVFQNYALYPQMSVYENIAFPLRINTYPYPVVDLELLSCNQLLNLLKETNFEELVEVYNGYSNVKAEYKKIEKYLSYKLGINENSANLLVKLWSIDKDQLEQSILEKVRIREEYNTTNNIQLNDKFEVLDSDGNVVIENRKMTEEEIRLKVYSAAETLDLGSYLDRLPKQLSGGQMQRVALGRAIVKNVPLFLMDEPLSNLDAKLRLLMRSEIVKLHRLINTTTIYVTHDQTEAMTMATRIVVMSRGFVQQIGSPEEIYNNPANMFVAKFIGSPTMNFFKTVYKNGTLYLNENLKMTLPQEVVQRHDEFHKNKINELTVIRDGFASEETAKHSREQILKILSGLGDDISSPVIKKEKTVWDRIKNLFKKQTVETVKVDEELNSCVEKLEKLTRNLEGNHNVILGIRPDKLKVRFYEKGETLSSNEIKVNVTVSELLGDVYNVHFNFGKQDVVCKFNVERCIRPGDELVVKFDMDNVYLFDEVTGGRIY